MPSGYRLNEIAHELGVAPSWVSQRLDELRSEIVLQSGGFLPLTDLEYAALKDSLAQHGQQVPVLIGQTGLIDGKHRIQALRELGVTEILVQFVLDTDAETERRISRTVNAARRMLNRAQKEALVRAELEHNWDRSSRQIGLDCGCTHNFVETIRNLVRAERAAATSDPVEDDEPVLTNIAGSDAPRSVSEAIRAVSIPPDQEIRIDKAGHRRRAYKSPRRGQETDGYRGATHNRGTCLAIVTCTCGQRHELHAVGPGHRTYVLRPLDD